MPRLVQVQNILPLYQTLRWPKHHETHHNMASYHDYYVFNVLEQCDDFTPCTLYISSYYGRVEKYVTLYSITVYATR